MGYVDISEDILERVCTERGSVPGMPWFGSRLHTLVTLGDVSLRLAEGFILEAINDLIRDKKIWDVSVDVKSDHGRLWWEIVWDDASGPKNTLVQKHVCPHSRLVKCELGGDYMKRCEDCGKEWLK
jgi:hypothetical protein